MPPSYDCPDFEKGFGAYPRKDHQFKAFMPFFAWVPMTS